MTKAMFNYQYSCVEGGVADVEGEPHPRPLPCREGRACRDMGDLPRRQAGKGVP